jgi:hypothetical protein|tara:strand:+ start:933 stop:1145 length:213 start_codon:yes stop_codon:yes gene_type:complete
MTIEQSFINDFEIEFIDDLRRLSLLKKDVAEKLEITMPTLNSKIQNPETFTVKDLKNLKELEFKLETLNI